MPFTLPVVARGARGDNAKTVQGLLVARGVAPPNTIRRDGSLDGIFGPGTEGSLKTLQTRQGLEATGSTDEGTWAALLLAEVTSGGGDGGDGGDGGTDGEFAVANLRVTNATASQLTMAWDPPATGTTERYRVGRDGTESGGGAPDWSGDVPADQRTLTFTNLKAGTPYRLHVTPQPGGVTRTIEHRTEATTVPDGGGGDGGTGGGGGGAPHELLAWRDEFDGNAMSWATDQGGGFWRTKGYEGGYGDPSLASGYIDYPGSSWNVNPQDADRLGLVTVNNGILTIKAMRNDGSIRKASENNADWFSVYLVSNHKNVDGLGRPLTWQYGYFEFRARIPNPVRGMFPALWMFNNIPDAEHPHKDRVGVEYDILEVFGERTGRPFHTSVWHRKPGLGTQTVPNTADPDRDTANWHRYGIEWTRDVIRYYYDGDVIVDVGVSSDPNNKPGAEWFRNAHMGLRIQYVMDPEWHHHGSPVRSTADDPPRGTQPRMEVDYVRVFSSMPDLPGGPDDPLA